MTDTTSAAPTPFTVESLKAALKAMRDLGPVPPQIEFYERFGRVYVVARRGAGMEPLGRMTLAEFEEFKAQLRAKVAR